MPGSRDSSGWSWISRVVAQVELVEPAVGRIDADGQQDVGRLLLGRHPGRLDDVGQQRHGQRDAVLHQHLRQVHVDAVLEGHRQAVVAVVGGHRRHVHHVLDAVDLLLDRRGHRLGDHLGAGAGILAGHADRRRRDRRIHRDRQRPRARAPPASVIAIDRTVAKIGRSMKKRENTGVARGVWGGQDPPRTSRLAGRGRTRGPAFRLPRDVNGPVGPTGTLAWSGRLPCRRGGRAVRHDSSATAGLAAGRRRSGPGPGPPRWMSAVRGRHGSGGRRSGGGFGAVGVLDGHGAGRFLLAAGRGHLLGQDVDPLAEPLHPGDDHPVAGLDPLLDLAIAVAQHADRRRRRSAWRHPVGSSLAFLTGLPSLSFFSLTTKTVLRPWSVTSACSRTISAGWGSPIGSRTRTNRPGTMKRLPLASGGLSILARNRSVPVLRSTRLSVKSTTPWCGKSFSSDQGELDGDRLLPLGLELDLALLHQPLDPEHAPARGRRSRRTADPG